MRTRVIRMALLPAVAAALVSAGCSDEGGQPSPTNAGQPSTPVSQPSQGGALGGVQACDLLTADDAASIGVKDSGKDDAGGGGTGTSRCTWTKPTEGGTGGFALSIVVRPEQGIDSFEVEPGNTRQEGDVAGRKAVMMKGDESGTSKGQCTIALAVGQTARVDVGVTAGTDTKLACDTANKIATIVEPKLPKDGG